MTEALSTCFPHRPQSCRAARRYVEHALDGVPVDVHAARLLVTELAANAITHARTDFEVRVAVTSAVVRVEVVDWAPDATLHFRSFTTYGGGGLRIVEALASRWGVRKAEDHKVVWFELGCRHVLGQSAPATPARADAQKSRIGLL